jgi:hypothetical protein
VDNFVNLVFTADAFYEVGVCNVTLDKRCVSHCLAMTVL